jgi:cytochrome c
MALETNKIVASLLVAGLVGMVSGLVSSGLVPKQKLEKDAYPIAVKAPAEAAAAPAAGDEKPAPIPDDLWAKADPAKGQEIAAKCQQCHTLDKGGPTKIGPNLYGVVDRPRGGQAGFSYSDAVKKLGGTWTPENIAEFIYKPSAYAPGTKMTFPGLPKAEDRADVIAYLNKDSDAPIDLAKAK